MLYRHLVNVVEDVGVDYSSNRGECSRLGTVGDLLQFRVPNHISVPTVPHTPPAALGGFNKLSLQIHIYT